MKAPSPWLWNLREPPFEALVITADLEHTRHINYVMCLCGLKVKLSTVCRTVQTLFKGHYGCLWWNKLTDTQPGRWCLVLFLAAPNHPLMNPFHPIVKSTDQLLSEPCFRMMRWKVPPYKVCDRDETGARQVRTAPVTARVMRTRVPRDPGPWRVSWRWASWPWPVSPRATMLRGSAVKRSIGFAIGFNNYGEG